MRSHESFGHSVLKASFLVVFALALVTMLGCKSTPTRIDGRVIEGTVGQAMVVGPADERLENLGIPGVEVVVLQAGGSAIRGKGVVGRATTDEEGNFSFKIKPGKHPAASVMVRVKGEWIFSSRSQTYLPTNAQKLLCTVITRDGYTPPEEPSNE